MIRRHAAVLAASQWKLARNARMYEARGVTDPLVRRSLIYAARRANHHFVRCIREAV